MGGIKTHYKLPNWLSLLFRLSSFVSWPNHIYVYIWYLMHWGHLLGTPFFKPSLPTPMQILNGVKLRVKPSPTLRFIIQFGMKAVFKWFGLQPGLGKPFHLRVCLKGHVTLPRFRNVNVLVDIIQGSLPFKTSISSFPWSTIVVYLLPWSKEPICVAFLCF